MFLKKLSTPDLVLGISTIATGAFVGYVAMDYPPGTTAHMGPGYLPRAMGAILIIMGCLLLAGSVVGQREKLPRFQLRACASITVAVVAFAFLISRTGFVSAVITATLLSALANPNVRLVPTLVLSVVLALITSLIFVWGLQLNAVLFRWPNF